MLKKTLVLAASSMLLAGPASAAFIAGWDHSQYLGANNPTLDGSTLATTLPANYSDFDPTFGAGAESAAFGTLYLDGSNGSDSVAMPPGFIPTSSSITLGVSLPQNTVPLGDVPFNSFNILESEGQTFQQDVAMIAQEALSVVYSSDLGSLFGNGYSFDFAGKSLAGGSTVGIDISSNGVDYTPFTSVNLGTTEATFNVDFGNALDGASTAFVRLNFDAGVGVIDNVGISAAEVVPEPGTLLLVSAGLAGLAYTSRRRNA